MDVLRGNFIRRFGRPPEAVTRAPGRIEFIGNHTDYNGGVVLGAAIDRAVWVALASRTDGRRRFATSWREGTAERPAADYARAEGVESWINYPLGVLAALGQRGLKTPAGFDYLAESDVPLGAGLSSSAAIELSSALAFGALTGQEFERETLVRIGRQAENDFVGVPCGILDQGVSGFGRAGHLVFIDCRGPRFDTVPLPAGAHFWIFNTHARHALVDGLYAARHVECMEAAKALGVPLLADATVSLLAERSSGLAEAQFKRAKHVIEEIGRVGACVRALRAGDLAQVGALLTQSHRSSQAWFENSTAELDFLVDHLTALPGVFGARLTGGGFGGAVMALTDETFGPAEGEQVSQAYRGKFGADLDVLHAQTANGAERVS
ncbi:MAG TPA: galactokinase [Opitutaceae bacterium]|jgi:galactokinase|nr:galactokinase [Opitutaceae bacterium]